MSSDPIRFHRWYSTLRTNNKKLLVTVGDSWTVGVGMVEEMSLDIHPNISKRCNFRLSYPYKLVKSIKGYDLLNAGLRGASNDTAIESFLSAMEVCREYEEVVVVFGLTTPIRHQLVFNNPDSKMYGRELFSLGNATQLDIDKHHRHFIQLWFTHVTGEQDNIRLLQNIHKFQLLCKVENFKYMIVSMFDIDGIDFTSDYIRQRSPHYQQEIDRTHFLHADGGNFKKELAEYSDDTGIPTETSCLHPNEAGNEYIAQRIHRFGNALGLWSSDF